MRLSFELRHDDASDDIVHKNADLEKAYAMLDMLDGEKYSHLNIERDDEHHMCVSGGAEQYVVINNCELSSAQALVNPDGHHEEIMEISTFGERNDVPTLIVVSRSEARTAIQYYYDETEDQLDWH